jgi:uncharacterized protein with ParB-like and HNH nuclease domain
MNETPIRLRAIEDLLEEVFYVPDFQRGYRWTAEQVRTLLDDVWKFRDDSQNATKEVFYCLQPVVVAQGDKGWVLIDGQQRLTTIHLILSHLKLYLDDAGKRKFQLTYQTRPESGFYLDKPIEEEANETPDYHHIYEAYITIEQWFRDKGGNAKSNFYNTLLNSDAEGKNVRIIWYEVPSTNTDTYIDIFTRLNIGKIPLTNAELVKALLLQKGNFSEEKATLKQIQIATEWDMIEQKLQQPDFWHFIYEPNELGAYDNHIELIFDLMYNRKKEDEKYFTFFEFNKEAQKTKTNNGKIDIDNLWLKVKRYFQTFEEWYNDRDFYHLIGFLVNCGEDLNTLKTESRNKSKSDFRTYLERLVSKSMMFDIKELEYGFVNDNKKIKRTLLLFNIHTLMTSREADVRFPFHRLKTMEWDIEHIRSQTTKVIRSEKQQREWINDVFEYFTGYTLNEWQAEESENLFDELKLKDEPEKFCNRILEINRSERIADYEFDDLRKSVESYFKEDTDQDEIKKEQTHSIGNLALLNAGINRSYKNALFPIKRKTIIEYDAKGEFIPICSKNAFLKYYSNRFDDLYSWSVSDAEAYQNAIVETLSKYMPTTNN